MLTTFGFLLPRLREWVAAERFCAHIGAGMVGGYEFLVTKERGIPNQSAHFQLSVRVDDHAYAEHLVSQGFGPLPWEDEY